MTASALTITQPNTLTQLPADVGVEERDMIVMLSNWRGTQFQDICAARPNIGNLLSPRGWATPPACPYALDNDCYANRLDPEWWGRQGEEKWLKMLNKIPADNPPIFVLLPDVVGDWMQTFDQARRYRRMLSRELPCAVALQDGFNIHTSQHIDMLRSMYIEWVFVGGSTKWKWANAEAICQKFQTMKMKVHIGRASGPLRIRECLRIGADSCDGTGWVRHSDAMLPGLWRELDSTNQQMRFEL